MTEPNEYLGSLDPDEFQAEEDFLNNHWANDMLDAPHALIAVIETKIARAVIAERKLILDILIANCNTYHTALMGCKCSVQIELIS
jgi:hypothetical protein